MKMSLKNKRVSFRIKENDIEIIEKAKEYCKERGIVFGKVYSRCFRLLYE